MAPAPQVQQSALDLKLLPRGRGLQLGAMLAFEQPQGPGPATLRLRLHPAMQVRSAHWGDRRVVVRRQGDSLVVPHPSGAGWALRLEAQGRPYLGQGRSAHQDASPQVVLLRPDGLWYPLPEAGPQGATSISWALPPAWVASVPGVGPGVSRGLLPPGSPVAFAAAPGQWHSLPGMALGAQGPASSIDQRNMRAMARLGWLPRLNLTWMAMPSGYTPLVLGTWRAAPRPQPGDLAAALWRPAEGPAAGWLQDGLAAFSADWAEALEEEEAEARGQALEKARQAHLERYLSARAHLVNEAPTAALVDPTHPSWNAVVKERGAVVWHLLAHQLGEERLRALLTQHQAAGPRPASLAGLVEAAGPEAAFLAEWLSQPGLPTLAWRNVRVVTPPFSHSRVEATLVQSQPTFPLRVPVSLVCEEGVVAQELVASGVETRLVLECPSRPMRLLVDPTESLPLRRRPHLRLVEALRATGLVIAYGAGGSSEEARANQDLANALAERLKLSTGTRPPVRADGALAPSERLGPLVLVGRPETHSLLAQWADQLPVRFIEGRALWWQGRNYQAPSTGIIQAIANPEAPDHAVVMMAGLSSQAAMDALNHLEADASFVVYEGASVLDQGLALRPFPDLDAVLY